MRKRSLDVATLTAQEALARQMTEAALLNKVRASAKALGWRMVHLGDSRKQVKTGALVGDTDAADFPDCVFIPVASAPRNRRVFYRELKGYDSHGALGALTAGQIRMLEDLRAAGEDADMWAPLDWARGVIEKRLMQ